MAVSSVSTGTRRYIDGSSVQRPAGLEVAVTDCAVSFRVFRNPVATAETVAGFAAQFALAVAHTGLAGLAQIANSVVITGPCRAIRIVRVSQLVAIVVDAVRTKPYLIICAADLIAKTITIVTVHVSVAVIVQTVIADLRSTAAHIHAGAVIAFALPFTTRNGVALVLVHVIAADQTNTRINAVAVNIRAVRVSVAVIVNAVITDFSCTGINGFSYAQPIFAPFCTFIIRGTGIVIVTGCT
jgi:hypothetical protein